MNILKRLLPAHEKKKLAMEKRKNEKALRSLGASKAEAEKITYRKFNNAG